MTMVWLADYDHLEAHAQPRRSPRWQCHASRNAQPAGNSLPAWKRRSCQVFFCLDLLSTLKMTVHCITYLDPPSSISTMFFSPRVDTYEFIQPPSGAKSKQSPGATTAPRHKAAKDFVAETPCRRSSLLHAGPPARGCESYPPTSFRVSQIEFPGRERAGQASTSTTLFSFYMWQMRLECPSITTIQSSRGW